MSLFESTLLSFYRPQSKLDLPTLRQGSRERKKETEQIKNMTLAWIFSYVCIISYVYICIYIYGEKNIVLVLVPRVDSDK